MRATRTSFTIRPCGAAGRSEDRSGGAEIASSWEGGEISRLFSASAPPRSRRILTYASGLPEAADALEVDSVRRVIEMLKDRAVDTQDRVTSSGEASLSTSLLVRLRERDPAGWQRLVVLFAPEVYRWCRQAGLRAHDAEDVGQEVVGLIEPRRFPPRPAGRLVSGMALHHHPQQGPRPLETRGPGSGGRGFRDPGPARPGPFP